MKNKIFLKPIELKNKVAINNKIYGTNINGKNIYELVNKKIAFFPGETILILENFQFTNKKDLIKSINKIIHNY